MMTISSSLAVWIVLQAWVLRRVGVRRERCLTRACRGSRNPSRKGGEKGSGVFLMWLTKKLPTPFSGPRVAKLAAEELTDALDTR